jgi:RimJ/RimL family protein N-acetyltransferase
MWLCRRAAKNRIHLKISKGMDTWIKHPTTLAGKLVELKPLDGSHFVELAIVASEKKIWSFLPLDCSVAENFQTVYSEALEERNNGNQYPFVIALRSTGALIGSTRLLDIQPAHRKLEIGWTWMHPDHWGTAVNLECKLLLMSFCFEQLKAIRVQLKTGDNNLRSRKAIEKIGGTFEGILRKERIRPNGTVRNSAFYSILDDEWETVKQNLENRLKEAKW